MIRMKRIRSRETNFDSNKLDRVHKILSDMNVYFQREIAIKNNKFNTKYKTRVPDFLIKTEYGDLILEIDGESVHGLFDLSESTRTTQRNTDYIRAGIHYEILNEGEAKYYKLPWESLVPYLINKGIAQMRASFKYGESVE